MSEEDEDPASRLVQIRQRLAAGEVSESVTVRELLSWFGAKRRGYYIVDHIRTALSGGG
jgi:hypothetical protein